jgi:hypothetical protein
MDLKHVQIINFRSIQNVTVDFSPRCRVLVGINESGKSNILRAMSFLGDRVPAPADDMREPLPDEAPLSQYTVRFVFSLKNELDEIVDAAKSKIYAADLDANHLVTKGKDKLNLSAFVQDRSEVIYRVDIDTAKKFPSYWILDDTKYSIASGWHKPSETCPVDYKIATSDGRLILLKSLAEAGPVPWTLSA